MSSLLLDAALQYAAHGWRVFPLVPGEKRPLTAQGCKDATKDADQICTWWTQHPDANIGIATGKDSGIVVVDVDAKSGKDGYESWKALGIEDIDTLKQLTWSGGSHAFFEYDEAVTNSVGKLGQGLDTRGQGGYVVGPPSQVNGKPYRWAGDWKKPLAPVPPEIIAKMQAAGSLSGNGHTKRSTAEWQRVMGGVPQGHRQDELAKVAGKLYASLDPVLARQQAHLWGDACIPPLSPREVDACCDRIEAKEDAKGNRRESPVRWRAGSDLDDTPISYLVEDMIPKGMLGAIGGRDGRGKTLFGMEVGKCVLTGSKLFDRFPVPQGTVFMMLLDDPEHLVRARLGAMGILDHPNLKVATQADVDMTDPARVLEFLAEQMATLQPTFVLIDALYLFVPSGGSGDQANSASAMRPVMQALDKVAEVSGATVAVVAHDNKAGVDLSGSQSIRNMLKWVIRVLLPTEFDDDPTGGVETNQRLLQLNKLKTGKPTSWRVTLDGPGRWEFEGTSAEHRAVSLERDIFEFVFDEPRTVVEISRGLRRKEEDIRRLCVGLSNVGKLVKGSRPRGGMSPGKPAVTYGIPDVGSKWPPLPWEKGR